MQSFVGEMQHLTPPSAKTVAHWKARRKRDLRRRKAKGPANESHEDMWAITVGDDRTGFGSTTFFSEFGLAKRHRYALALGLDVSIRCNVVLRLDLHEGDGDGVEYLVPAQYVNQWDVSAPYGRREF